MLQFNKKVQVYKSAAYNRLFVTVYRADKRRYVTKYASFTRTWWYETFMKWCIIFHFLTGMLNYIFWEKAPYTVMSWYYTLLQKLSKCEVKAWLCRNSINLPPLWFSVKSNFGEFKRSKNVIFGNLKGSEFWY